MRLTDLNPKFLSSFDADGETKGMGVRLDCPCGRREEWHELYVPFENRIGPGPLADKTDPRGWKRTGDTFETLTLTPSILRVDTPTEGGCGWHGYITNGEIVTV